MQNDNARAGGGRCAYACACVRARNDVAEGCCEMEERITRGKAIRKKCLDCCCGSSAQVRRCSAVNCPLWRYRMGGEKNAVRLLKRVGAKKK